MPIDFSRLRLQNIFGQNPFSNGMPLPSVTEPEPDYDADARMRQLYQPQMDMQNRMSSQIDTMPQRNDFRLNKIRQIGAMLAGLGAGRPAGMWGGNPVGYEANIPQSMAIQEELNNRPYNRALSDWQLKTGVIDKAADNERMSNINNRILANETVGRELQDRTQRRLENRDVVRAENERRNIDIRQQRADIYALKNSMPNIKFDFSGPTVLAADPNTGKVTDTRIPTGSLSDADKLALQHDYSMEEITARGEQARTTKATIPGKNTSPVERPPVEPVTTEEEVFDASGKSGGRRITTRTTGNNTNKSKPNTGGTVRMIGQDGKTYNIPADKVDDATKNYGMKRAQ